MYDYGKPNSKVLASQGGDLVHMSISRLSSKCIVCFFFFLLNVGCNPYRHVLQV